MQSLSSSSMLDDLAIRCSADLLRTFCAVLQRDAIDDATWAIATLPLRKGGLGLRDPATILPAARLASLINIEECVKGYGADPFTYTN